MLLMIHNYDSFTRIRMRCLQPSSSEVERGRMPYSLAISTRRFS